LRWLDRRSIRLASTPVMKAWRSAASYRTCTGTWRPATLRWCRAGSRPRWNLTANRKPFLYFPLAHHFEQNFHVPHRLNRYRAGRRMDYNSADPDSIAAAIGQELDRELDYLPVESDGAKRAAALIGELL
jgi:hypothetical protein